MKNIVILLGPGACGKSTLMQKLVGNNATDLRMPLFLEQSVKCCFSHDGTIAVPGSYKNGSDSISKMADRALLVRHLLEDQAVKTIILDGVRTSIKWDVAWLTALSHTVNIIYVYFDISIKENIDRLLNRRRANGKVEKTLPADTHSNMLAFRTRAKRVWDAASKQTNVKLIHLTNETPRQAVILVQRSLR